MLVKICAVNSKFLHSNPAVYSLLCYYNSIADRDTNVKIKICEYTVNDAYKTVLLSLLSDNPQIIAFSVYIWNVEFISKLCGDIKKIDPQVKIILGGPEVSYGGLTFGESTYDYIIAGEGERTFFCLINKICGVDIPYYADKFGFRQLTAASEKIFISDEIKNLDEIPFIYSQPYIDLEVFRNRIIYYETSRGCPFSCTYCLSACGKGVRTLSQRRIYSDIDFFMRQNSLIRQVKFVDRTFNGDKNRAYWIFDYIIKNSENAGEINFHFEICADLLDRGLINLLSTAKPGLIQFEIGIQTTNLKSLELCSRKTDIKKCFENIRLLLKNGNINIHVDLIAGLPEDTYGSFKGSFNRVYALNAHQFQLGFLKLLKGAPLNTEENLERYNYKFSEHPPYEILSSGSMTHGDIAVLNQIEIVLDKFYNSGRFTETLKYIMEFFSSPFDFFLQMSVYMKSCDLLYRPLSLENIYAVILDFFGSIDILNTAYMNYLKEMLLLDYFCGDAYDNPPKIIRDVWQPYKTYSSSSNNLKPENFTLRKIGENLYWFDYTKKNPVTGRYNYILYKAQV